ncbi:hypothetical protein O1L60_45410 [Streptomyces diastatochromogenes]|nr:hypothetical protein [Streptomyces diastatochromogenes]
MASTSRRPAPAAPPPAAPPPAATPPPGGRRPRSWYRRLPARDRGSVLLVAAVALFLIGNYLSRHPAVLAALLVLLGLAAVAAGYFGAAAGSAAGAAPAGAHCPPPSTAGGP